MPPVEEGDEPDEGHAKEFEHGVAAGHLRRESIVNMMGELRSSYTLATIRRVGLEGFKLCQCGLGGRGG
jgi:hypothetical protein